MMHMNRSTWHDDVYFRDLYILQNKYAQIVTPAYLLELQAAS